MCGSLRRTFGVSFYGRTLASCAELEEFLLELFSSVFEEKQELGGRGTSLVSAGVCVAFRGRKVLNGGRM